MTIWLVTRHAGAREWAHLRGFAVDRVVQHLESESDIAAGDVVIGSLPANLAARLCERGGRYLHLSLDLPFEKRGIELTADDMEHLGARLEEIALRRVADFTSPRPAVP